MRRWWLLLSCLPIASLPLASCAPTLSPAQETVARVPSITGQVTDLSGRTSQATIYDVAAGATVSLIDTTTGQTVGTTVTTPSGGFSLSFGHFNPGPQPYYLEAVKGLPVGSNANRAGASVARVRTILYFNGGWTSLNDPSPNGPVNIGTATTALCDIVNLRGLSASNLVGCLNGTTFTPPAGSAITQAEYGSVWNMVSSLLAADEDPVEAIAYDSNLAQPYVTKPGDLLIYDNYSVNGVTNATASLSAPYNQVVFIGQNFPSTASFSVGPVPVASWSVNLTRTQLSVTLPSNACSGELLVSQGSSTWTGPFVPISGTVGTLVGSGFAGNAEGKGSAAQLRYPAGLAVDTSGNVYIADTQNYCIRKVTPAGAMTTFAGTPGVSGHVDGTGTSARLNNPGSVAFDGSGNLIVGDGTYLRKITPAGVVSTLAGNGQSGYLDGAAGAAEFAGTAGLCVDGSGNVYIADMNNQSVRELTTSGTVTTVAGSHSVNATTGAWSGVAGSADGTGTGAMFYCPHSVAVDGSGNVYVADIYNSKIRKIAPGGVVSGFASFSDPFGIVSDGLGNFYTQGNPFVVAKIGPTGTVTTVAGAGSAGFYDGPRLSAQFNENWSQGIAYWNGRIYVADEQNQRVRVIVL